MDPHLQWRARHLCGNIRIYQRFAAAVIERTRVVAPKALFKLTVYALLVSLVLESSARAQEGESYTTRIDTTPEFERFSIPETHLPGVDRIAKFLVPAGDDPGLLPPVFQNVGVYPKHQEFLAAEFPDRFPGLGGAEYLALVERRATRPCCLEGTAQSVRVGDGTLLRELGELCWCGL